MRPAHTHTRTHTHTHTRTHTQTQWNHEVDINNMREKQMYSINMQSKTLAHYSVKWEECDTLSYTKYARNYCNS